ncbi:LPS export ABC transporter periplasmic protein LptC [bacterium]
MIILAFLLGCRQSDQSMANDVIQSGADTTSIPDREGWDASIRISSDGDLRAIIEYGHMTFYNHTKINYFDQSVQVDMFDENGKHTTKLTAEKGEYHEANQNIWAIGQVVVVSDTGVTLFTPIGRWDQGLEKIISDTVVMVTTVENDTIYGSSFQSNADLSHYIIENPRGTREERINFDALEKEMTSPVSIDSTVYQ